MQLLVVVGGMEGCLGVQVDMVRRVLVEDPTGTLPRP